MRGSWVSDGDSSPVTTIRGLSLDPTQDNTEIDAGTNVQTAAEKGELMKHVNHLPSEILLHVFSFLSVVELCRSVAPVCRAWRKLSHDPSLWTHLVLPQFPVVREQVLELLARAPRLIHLELKNCQNSQELLFFIAENCPRLQHLTLKSSEGITEAAMDMMVYKCSELQHLNMERSPAISDVCYYSLSQLKHLTFLNLSHCCYLNDAGLILIATKCSNLQYLYIDGNPDINNPSVGRMAYLLAGTLRHICLDGENLTDPAFLALEYCKQLELIGVSNCKRMTTIGLSGLQSLPRLTWLKLRKGEELRPAGLIDFFRNNNLKNLTYINLGDCTLLDDTVLDALSDTCRKLQHLDLSRCMEVTDTGMSFVVAGCPHLVELILVDLENVTRNFLSLLINSLPKLSLMDLRYCHAMDLGSLRSLVIIRPTLKVIDYRGNVVVISDYYVPDISPQPSP